MHDPSPDTMEETFGSALTPSGVTVGPLSTMTPPPTQRLPVTHSSRTKQRAPMGTSPTNGSGHCWNRAQGSVVDELGEEQAPAAKSAMQAAALAGSRAMRFPVTDARASPNQVWSDITVGGTQSASVR